MADYFTVRNNTQSIYCGHKHRSAYTAAKCMRKSAISCEKSGGYFSGYVAHKVDGADVELDGFEQFSVHQARCGYIK